MKNIPRLLIWITGIGLMLRIIWGLLAPQSLDQLPDQREYFSLAQNLLHHGSLNFFDSRFSQTIWAYRMPGYPLFLAACGGSIPIIRIAQALIDTSTLLAVFLITRQLTASNNIALIAAAVMAVNPFYVYFSGLILSETLFAALLAWAIWFLISQRWFLATLFLIASCYVRPGGLLFIPFLILAGNLNQPLRPAYRLRNTLAASIITIVCLIPWAWRNHQILHTWIWTTTNSGITTFDGFNPSATGGSDQRFIADFSQLSSMNEVERSRFFAGKAMEWAEQNRSRIAVLSARKFLRGWSPIPLSQEFGKPLYRFSSAMYAVPFDLLCVLGIFSPRLNGRMKILLLAPAVLVTVLQLLSVGSIRYRMPAEAPMAVIVAVGLADLWAKFGKRKPE